MVAKAVLIREATGVIPLPPPRSSKGARESRSTKRPAGGGTSSSAPGASRPLNQFEMRPSSIRLTVTFHSPASLTGQLDSE